MDKEILILMYKDLEVLSFEVDYVETQIKLIEKLEHFDKAPYSFVDAEDINIKLLRFFCSRSIPVQRRGYEKILAATNCRSGFELSFKGHGLSFSNQFWVKRIGENLKYDDINFFANKWDDTFGRSIINEDYETLKTCDLNVPDIVTPGWGVKAWVYENEPKLYKFGIHDGCSEEAICEVLASRLANRIFNPGEALLYELKEVNGRYASVSPLLVNEDEELFPLINFLPYQYYMLFKGRNCDKKLGKEFFDKIKECGLPELFDFFVKLSCLRTICFVSDLHFDNISLIRNSKTNTIRVAPLYDLGGAFGSTQTGKNLISNANKGTLLMIYFLFNDLDPEWDYSWYNPDKLVGFEDEIREYLSKSEFYTPEITNCIIDVYHQQKKTLDDAAKGAK